MGCDGPALGYIIQYRDTRHSVTTLWETHYVSTVTPDSSSSNHKPALSPIPILI